MLIFRNQYLWIVCLFLLFAIKSFAQISPGELAKVHAHLEAISNCTKCHTLGAKVSNDKCLACHTEVKARVDAKKGYHSSKEQKGKQCAECHNDHHGKNFQIVRFDTAKFDHNLAGYKLDGKHLKRKCTDCHAQKNIVNQNIKTKTFTYLGLTAECVLCHVDVHEKTLAGSCGNCHGIDGFKPAGKFNHATSKYPLIGMHQKVECVKCHKIETKDGKKFQFFNGMEFKLCTNCHKDVHQNRLGQNCTQCHNEFSFKTNVNKNVFDHNKTKYKLEDKHIVVECKKCHKTKTTDPLKFEKCTDCHADFHKNQFAQSGVSPDCSKCHTLKGFSPSLYTIEQHNQGVFKLLNAHLATPCFECHKKDEKWNFKDLAKRCNDCHTNIHKTFIDAKYYPDENCKICHTEKKWSDVNFDHKKTEFELTGAHPKASCKSCHYKKISDKESQQKFAGLSKVCVNCHIDKHNKEFEANGITDCNRCHETLNWKATKFNHDGTAYKLDGKHKNVACAKCHKPDADKKYINFKIKEYKCESCHLF